MEKTISISGCVLILTVYIARLFYMADPFHIFPLLTAVWLGVCWWHRPLRPTPIDICLVALWAYGMLAPTVNPIGSMAATSRLTASVLIYFTARTIFALYGAAGRRMLAVLTAGIVMMTAAALFQFGMFADKVYAVDFESLYEFRFLYTPFGQPVNVWNALMWLWGGIAVATYAECRSRRVSLMALVAGCMVWTMIVLSFSRGGYIAAAICLPAMLVLLLRTTTKRHAVIIMSCYALLTAGLYLKYKSDIDTAISMNSTTSQQRSTSGRISTIKQARDIVKENPWGTGAGTYTLAKDYYMHGNGRSDSHTSYAPNIFTQVSVEGGWPGMVIYITFIVCIMIWTVRSGRHNMWAVFIPMAGYFVKEQTFPTFFVSDITRISALILLAYIQKDSGQAKPGPTARIAAGIPAVAWAGIIYAGMACKSNGCQEISKSRMDSRTIFDRAVQSDDMPALQRLASDYPDILVYRWTIYERYRKDGQPEKAAHELAAAVLRHPRILETDYWNKLKQDDDEFSRKVSREVIHTITCTQPEDAIECAKYGRAAMLLGEPGTAYRYLEQAVTRLPTFSRPWAWLSVMHSHRNEENTARLYLRRYTLLEHGMFADIDNGTPPEPQRDIESLTDAGYKIKCMEWYGTLPAKRNQ